MPKHDDVFLETTIGEVVRSWRRHHGLTVTELAAQAGPPITKGYVSQLERDKIRTPGDTKLAQLARALGVSVRDLVNRRLPADLVGKEADLEQPPVRSLGPVFSALPEPPDDDEQTTGRRVERLIAAARLTEKEEELVANYLVETAERVLELLRSAPRLG